MLNDMMNRAIKAEGVDAAWNTGREYSKEKQRVSAFVGEDGHVCFADIDRSIQGVLHASYHREDKIDPVDLAAFVMREYDEGRYKSGFYHLIDLPIADVQATLRTAAQSIGPEGFRIPKAHQLPGVADAALAVLSGYPGDAKASEFYDADDEFASALQAVAGESFEYPDHAHKTVGDLVKGFRKEHLAQSFSDAGVLARSKGAVDYIDRAIDQTYIGTVMGLTGSHVVFSLGRKALIVRQSDLDQIPAKGADVKITFRGGKGTVSEQGVANEIGR